MSQRICQLILLVCLEHAGGSIAWCATAPGVADDPANCKIRRWTTEDGLPQNRVACLQQTRDGYLWIGTWFGVARFDGARFVVFNRHNTPAFTSDAINALAEDADGALWIATSDGLVKYNGGTFRHFAPADGLPNEHVWRLAAARGGGVWLQAGANVTLCQQDQFTPVWYYPDGSTVHAMEVDTNGNLNIFLDHEWLVLAETASRAVDGGNLPSEASGGHEAVGLAARLKRQVAHAAQALNPNFQLKTNYLAPADSARFLDAGLRNSAAVAFVATGAGLRLLDCGRTNIMPVPGWGEAPTHVLHVDRSGNLWAQNRTRGLMRFDGANWQSIGLGEMSSDLVCCAQDAQGNLWLGTTDGLVQLRFQKVRMVTTRDGLADDNIWAVCEAATNDFWIGTDRGVCELRHGRAKTIPYPTGVPNQAIRSVWPGQDGAVYVTTSANGILKMVDGQFGQLVDGLVLAGALFEDGQGRLWTAALGGLRCYQNCRPQPLPTALSSLSNVHAILEDQAGSFWFGLAAGKLAHWRNNSLFVFTARNGLPDGGVWAIHQDANGVLWLGTEKGLVRFAHGAFSQFTARQQMPEDTVNCVLEDDAGNLWLSTLHGIYRVSRAQLNAVADGKAATAQPFIVGTADGMLTAESNGEMQPAGWKAHDGRLWFATGKGVAVIDPKLFSEPEAPPRALFESVKADGHELFTAGRAGSLPADSFGSQHAGKLPALPESNEKIRIAAGGGHALEFRFTACDLAAPEQVRFRTRLAGVDRDWSAPSPQRQVDFFDLRPGDYRLEILAVDHHGLASAPTVVAFSIAPYFWQTWWFYALCGGGLMAMAAGVQAYRLRWQSRLFSLEQQRALASERARIARDLHDDLGTALTGMALELDVLGREAKNSPPLMKRLGQAAQHTRQLAERMREVVWVVNPRCDNVRSFADFLEDQAALLLQKAGLKVRLDFPVEIPDLPMDANVRHELALSAREAFTNLVRHARATEADVHLELSADKLVVRIRDNGRGFDPQPQLNKPHGILNLKQRMEEIGGAFEIVSTPGGGTEITFTVPTSKLKTKKS